MPSDTAGLLVYDGNCGFCSLVATWIARRWRGSGVGSVVASQRLGDAELRRLGLTKDDVATSAWWIDGDRHYGGHLAIARVMIAMGTGWSLLGLLLLIPPFRWLAWVGYRLVARFRHRLPGGTPACKS